MTALTPESEKEEKGIKYPMVSVVVVNYRSGPYLACCLEALANQTWRDFEVLIVDNDSDEGSAASLRENNPSVRLITPDFNLGFAAANNLAVLQARGVWIATLNPDAFPDTLWLESLMAATYRNPGFSLFASLQLDYNNPVVLDGAGDPYCSLGFAWRGGKGRDYGLIPQEGKTFGPCAAAGLYRRDAFLAVRGFDESFFCYYEDVDLAFRMRLAGHACIFVPAAQVDHVGSAVSGVMSSFSVYHITRNRIWTFVKCMPRPLFVMLVIPAAAVLIHSMLRGKGLDKARAMRDAILALPAVWVARRKIQAQRLVSSMEIADALTWSPSKILFKDPDVRFIPPVQPLGDERVCAVVVSYFSGQRLITNLNALLAQVEHVLVVDNGAGVDIKKAVENLVARSSGRLEVLEDKGNLGLARAQNRGINYAMKKGFQWILLMDDDSLPEADMVGNLQAAYRESPRQNPIGLLAPRIKREGMHSNQSFTIAHHRWHLARRSFGGEPVIQDLIFAIASGSLISASALKHVGLMRDDFFIDYVDVEFCLRLREAGYTIAAVNAACLAHRIGSTEECRLAGHSIPVTHHSSLRRYYIFRNRVYLWRTQWSRWPMWVVFDSGAALFDLVRIVYFESDKWAKLKGALAGAWDGVRKRLSDIDT